jgi:hypothetical protein
MNAARFEVRAEALEKGANERGFLVDRPRA